MVHYILFSRSQLVWAQRGETDHAKHASRIVGGRVLVTTPLLAGLIWRPSRDRAGDLTPMSLIHLCLQILKMFVFKT